MYIIIYITLSYFNNIRLFRFQFQFQSIINTRIIHLNKILFIIYKHFMLYIL
jgi:hypothetical protein